MTSKAEIDLYESIDAAVARATGRWRVGVVATDGRSGSWHAEPPALSERRWVYAEPEDVTLPAVGWKLHVSATPWSAEDVLSRALPVLIEQGASFKVAASPVVIAALNEGEGGLTQIGKFITVYPVDEPAAIKLADALHRATVGLRGPVVPTDRALNASSLVHYRYARFEPQVDEHPPEPIEGKLVAVDSGDVDVPQPEIDPFVLEGIAETPSSGLIEDRYLVTSTIYSSPRGHVHIASDLKELRPCILKRAVRDARAEPDGTDARDQLRHEASVLQLMGDGRVPEVYGFIEEGDDLLLAMELVDGEKLSRHVARYVAANRPVPSHAIVKWGRETAGFVRDLHARGLVYRDLSSANVMVTPTWSLRFLDFELAREVGAGTTFYAAGTPGYCSPEQVGGRPAEFSDDLYGLGALLFFLATREEPPETPDLFDHLDEHGIDPTLVTIIDRCVAVDPSARWSSVGDVDAALERWGSSLLDD
jgi:hypothetical protein